MAKTYKAVLQFLDANGKTVTFSYNNAKDEPNQSSITAAMDAFIANGSILKKVPVSKKAAYIVETNQTAYAVE